MVRYLRAPRILARVVRRLRGRLRRRTTLCVRTGPTGRGQRFPVNVLESAGRRYLVCARGDARWVHSLRSADTCELRRSGWTQCFTVVEVPPAERPALIAQYRSRWDRTDPGFADLPDPADHPVFELRS